MMSFKQGAHEPFENGSTLQHLLLSMLQVLAQALDQ